jgi:hypothetical protein
MKRSSPPGGALLAALALLGAGVAGAQSLDGAAPLPGATAADDPAAAARPARAPPRRWSLAAWGGYQLMFDRPTAEGGTFPSAPVVGGEIGLHELFGGGFALSVDGQYGWAPGAVASTLLGNPTYQYTLVGGGAGLRYEWAPSGRFIPFAGVHLGLDVLRRTFDDPRFPDQSYTVFTPGAVVGLKVRLFRGFSVVAQARAQYLLYNVDEIRHLGSADLGLLLEYEVR